MPRKSNTTKAWKRNSEDKKSGRKSNKKSNHTRKDSFIADLDNDGLVDGSEKTALQIYDFGSPLFITKKSGQTLSDRTSRQWSASAAAPTKGGHIVLITKNRSKQIKYSTWRLNKNGVLRSKGPWVLGSELSPKGHEETFAIDFNGDGILEGDTLIDAGDAHYVLTGVAAVGQQLKVEQKVKDPDGDGRPRITWQASRKTTTWEAIGNGATFKIPTALEGFRIRAKIDYTDGDGFDESIDTDSLNIPYVDDGDAAFLIQGSPAVGQTLSIQRSNSDPDGDGTPTISWFQSTDGVNWSLASSNDTFNIPAGLEGRRITATVNYTDAQGFDESIDTDSLNIPYVDDIDTNARYHCAAGISLIRW